MKEAGRKERQGGRERGKGAREGREGRENRTHRRGTHLPIIMSNISNINDAYFGSRIKKRVNSRTGYSSSSFRPDRAIFRPSLLPSSCNTL